MNDKPGELTCTKVTQKKPELRCGKSMTELLLISRDRVLWAAYPRCGEGEHTAQADMDAMAMVLEGIGAEDGPVMASIQFGELEPIDGPLPPGYRQEWPARQAEDVNPDARLI